MSKHPGGCEEGSDLALAHSLADAADLITLSRFRAGDLRVATKPDRTPVTDADIATEDRIRELVAAEAGSDSVVGEEHGGDRAPDRCWLVDPIDGTKNFTRGLPVWATLIALLCRGAPVVAVASAPALGRRWWAASGSGAFVRDVTGARRIHVSGVTELADAYVSTTNLAEHRPARPYLDLLAACWESRAYGDFWQHCLVAEGGIDLAVDPAASPWDLAAVRLIVTEAGGEFTSLAGERRHDGGSALASNGLLHTAALKMLRGRGCLNSPGGTAGQG
jgi:histidinol-phosphatase